MQIPEGLIRKSLSILPFQSCSDGEGKLIKKIDRTIIPNAVKATTDGMSVISVFDVKEGKLEECLALQQKQLLAYHVIPGYKYKMEVRFNIVEAIEMLGMKIPE